MFSRSESMDEVSEGAAEERKLRQPKCPSICISDTTTLPVHSLLATVNGLKGCGSFSVGTIFGFSCLFHIESMQFAHLSPVFVTVSHPITSHYFYNGRPSYIRVNLYCTKR